MAENAWLEIPNSNVSAVQPDLTAEPYNWIVTDWAGGSSALTNAWCGGCWDSSRQRLILMGGGHADYPDNAVYAFDFQTFTWSRLTDPSVRPESNSGNDPPYWYHFADGAPATWHTYAGLIYHPDLDALVIPAQHAVWSPNGHHGQESFKLSFPGNVWSQINNQTLAGDPQIGRGEYNPTDGLLYYAMSGSGGSGYTPLTYDDGTGNWTTYTLAQNVNLGGGQDELCIDVARQRIYILGNGIGLIGGGHHGVLYDTVAAWGDDPTEPTPSGDTGILAEHLGAAYDPISEDIWMYAEERPTKVVRLDTSDHSLTEITTTSSPSGTDLTQNQHGVFGKWQYWVEEDRFVLYGRTTANVHVYRPQRS